MTNRTMLLPRLTVSWRRISPPAPAEENQFVSTAEEEEEFVTAEEEEEEMVRRFHFLIRH